jgi:hypothetical protein
MHAADLPMPPIAARLESEIQTLRNALCLSRQRAEDAESDLEEVRCESQDHCARADEAERQLDLLQAQLDGAAPSPKYRLPLAPALADSPEATAIAQELNRVMAESQRLADAPQMQAVPRKR